MKHLTQLFKTYLKTNPRYLTDFIPIVNSLSSFQYCLKGKLPLHPNIGISRFTLEKGKRWEIALISWDPGCASLIHNHPSGGCILMPLNGTLIEERYKHGILTNTNTLLKKEVSYADGPNYYHKIRNIDRFKIIQSLHIYLHHH